MLNRARKLGVRRSRRGLSLMETALTVMVLIAGFQAGLQVWKAAVARQAHQAEMWALAQVADAAQSLAEQDLLAEIAATRATATSVREIDEAELRATGVLPDSARLFSSTGRDIDVWAFAPSDEELILIARATGDLEMANIPRGADGLGRIGWVSPLDADMLRGPGLEMDVSFLQANHGFPVAGDTAAVRYLNVDADLRPFLYREAVDPAFAELNRMETDLDLGGNDLTNVTNMQITAMETETLTVGTMTATGDVTADDLDVAGDLSVGGDLSARSAEVSELVTGPLTATDVAADTVSATGAVTANNVAVAGELIAGSAAIGGNLLADTLTLNNLDADAVIAESFTASNVGVDTLTGAEFGVFDNVITGSCTGC